MQDWQHPPSTPATPKSSWSGLSTGARIAIGCGGCGGALLIGLVMMIVLGAALDSQSSDDGGGGTAAEETRDGGGDGESAEETEDGGDEPAEEEDPPVLVEAEATEFSPSMLNDGGDYTSVHITVTNNSEENVSVNPLYFYIIDTDGTKHDTSSGLGEADDQIDTMDLAPGENTAGTITAEGDFEPARVSFEEGIFGEAIEAQVR